MPRGERLLLAVQTKKLVIDGALTAANRLSCSVTEVLYQGESLRVFATLADGTSISLRQPGSHEGRRRISVPGAKMTVALHLQDTIVVAA